MPGGEAKSDVARRLEIKGLFGTTIQFNHRVDKYRSRVRCFFAGKATPIIQKIEGRAVSKPLREKSVGKSLLSAPPSDTPGRYNNAIVIA